MKLVELDRTGNGTVISTHLEYLGKLAKLMPTSIARSSTEVAALGARLATRSYWSNTLKLVGICPQLQLQESGGY